VATWVQKWLKWNAIFKQCYISGKLGTAVSQDLNAIVEKALNLTSEVLPLDEADVFLEERGIADLERNSLVSGNLFTPTIIYILNVATSIPSNSRVL
jgi:hypothetical protein